MSIFLMSNLWKIKRGCGVRMMGENCFLGKMEISGGVGVISDIHSVVVMITLLINCTCTQYSY